MRANHPIKTKTQRQELTPRPKPYNNSLGPRRLLGYIRRAGAAGSWVVDVEINRAKSGRSIRRQKMLGLADDYAHETVDHAIEYVVGAVHTNGLENFWSLLKRAVKGTYVSVEPFHLFRYLDEQAFRFNNRKTTDRGRFVHAMLSVVGKRLTYPTLTGATLCRP